jgi:hypothetical protein
MLGAVPTEIFIQGNEWTYTHTLHTNRRNERGVHVYRVSRKSLELEKFEYLHDSSTKWADFFSEGREHIEVFIDGEKVHLWA